jgi:hypothetical protein
VRQRFARPLVIVVMLAWATSAAADTAVTFNFQTNSGFVDRSEAQTAFGLNHGQMQKRASQVVFSAVETVTLAVNCANGAVRQAVTETTGTVDFTLVPTKGSFDGFSLAGLRDILISDPQPTDVICGGPGSLGGQIAVVRRLSASLGGQSIVLIEEH